MFAPGRPLLSFITALALVSAACGTSEDGSSAQPDRSGPAVSAPTPELSKENETVEPSACQAAPADTASVMTGPEWSTGDQRSLEVEIRKSANPEGVSLTPVTLTVLEASEEIGVRFEWQSGQTMVNGLPSSPEVDRLLEQTPREQIVYSLDRNRAFTGVENVDQIRSAYREIADLLGEAGMPQAEAGPGLFDGLSDEAVAQIFSERPVIYHSLEGIVLGFDETITFDDILPNAFGGEPFPAVTVIEITDLDDPDGCAEITMTVRPDPDDFLRILGESMQAAGLVDDENPFDPGDAGAEIENKIVAQYDTSTGFLRSVYGSQLIQFDGQRRFDETMIRDVTGR